MLCSAAMLEQEEASLKLSYRVIADHAIAQNLLLFFYSWCSCFNTATSAKTFVPPTVRLRSHKTRVKFASTACLLYQSCCLTLVHKRDALDGCGRS